MFYWVFKSFWSLPSSIHGSCFGSLQQGWNNMYGIAKWQFPVRQLVVCYFAPWQHVCCIHLDSIFVGFTLTAFMLWPHHLRCIVPAIWWIVTFDEVFLVLQPWQLSAPLHLLWEVAIKLVTLAVELPFLAEWLECLPWRHANCINRKRCYWP